ncbi:MAG: 3-oxoacyl-ACP reductase FabG [Desulfobacteraceae bacterium]|nr:3-oxoacyl-ACP reductase FabG [Desulfobacteraceae bacterium]
MMRFEDKVALVTGGGSGMGEATCLGFAREGADIAIFDLNIENTEKVAASVRDLGRKAVALKVDVADFQGVNASVQRVYEELSHIDILINGAGYGQYVPLSEMSEEAWDRSIAVHLKGTFTCTRAVINGMIEQKWGKIVSISSISGIVGTPTHSHYSAAKAGVIGMSKALAKEVAVCGLNVNVVAPGAIETPFQDGLRRDNPELLKRFAESVPMGRMGNAGEVAAIILFLCSKDAEFITGQVISPNGGMVIY